jgi:peptidoglycan hydrolase-like protein with peptidoglycan-binding domain
MTTYSGKTLGLGSKGVEVAQVQEFFRIVGDFGANTLNSVKAYQSANKLTVDGIIGQKTWDSMFPPVVTGTAPVWQSSQCPGGKVGEKYSFQYVTNADPAAKFKISSGVLPPGVTLTPDGLQSGVPSKDGSWSFSVMAYNGIAPDISNPEQMPRERTVVISPAVVVVPPSPVGGVYGTGTGIDTRSNINVGTAEGGAGQRLAVKWRASTTSALQSVRFVQRGGPVYSHGNGGTTTVTIQGDDGAGHPNGVVLGTGKWAKGNPPSGQSASAWETFDAVTLSPQPMLTAGTIYYAVFENPDPNNNISVNLVYLFNKTVPRQPRYKDSDFGALITRGVWGGIDSGHLPTIDLAYANGVHDGQGYIGAMIDKWAEINGTTKMIREAFTVSGGDKVIKTLAARLRRTSGNGPLIMTLETAAGVLIESVSVPAANIPVVAPGNDNGGSTWAKANLTTPRTLLNGEKYNLRLSSTGGGVYNAFPIQQGGSKGLLSWTFSSGNGQKTTNNGSTWEDMYPWDRQNMQWYADLVV